jgi:hypothetical protein
MKFDAIFVINYEKSKIEAETDEIEYVIIKIKYE